MFYFSLLCCRHAHRESTLVSLLSLAFFSFFLPSFLDAICSLSLAASRFLHAFPYLALRVRYSTRGTHTSNAPTLDINKTLDFLKDSPLLAAVASVNDSRTRRISTRAISCTCCWPARRGTLDARVRSLVAMSRRRVQHARATMTFSGKQHSSSSSSSSSSFHLHWCLEIEASFSR